MTHITGTSKGETLSATSRNDVVKGLGGDDILYGGLSSNIEENNSDGDDVLYGGAGNDQLFDAGGEDRLYGGDGDDLIAVYNHAAIDSGKRGGDKIYGGAGDDDIQVRYSIGPTLKETVYIDGGSGVDRAVHDLSGFKSGATFTVSATKTVTIGSVTLKRIERVSLDGGVGDDNFTGGAGTDYLKGGHGNDRLIGRAGDDELHGGVRQGDRSSEYYGYYLPDGDDYVDAGAGNDTITDYGGANTIRAGSGDDRVDIGEGGDYFWWEKGQDLGDSAPETVPFDATANGSYTVDLGSGNDRLGWRGGPLGALDIDGGHGSDHVWLDFRYVGFTKDLTFALASVATFTNVSVTLKNIESVTLFGGSGNDTFTGGALADEMAGGGGDDTLEGQGGHDRLIGGAGSDTIRGGAGNDTIYGGMAFSNGDGTLRPYDDDVDDKIYGGAGNDTIYAGHGDTADGGTGIDTLNFVLVTEEDFVFDFTTGTVAVDPETIFSNFEVLNYGGGTGRDNVTGGSRGDTLFGGAGDDTLIGGGGNDTLDGGLGTDSMEGDVGNDIYVVNSRRDKVVEKTKEGTDRVESSIDYMLTANVENLTLTGKAHNGTGNSLDNTIIGSDRKNMLDGGAGVDILKGGMNDDRLIGGGGGDKLRGGSGSDTFIYKTLQDSTPGKSGRDTIFDFSKSDKIDISAIDASTKKGGNQGFTFIGTDDFSKRAGELRYDKGKSNTYIRGDVDGDGKADFAIHLDDVRTLDKADFIL